VVPCDIAERVRRARALTQACELCELRCGVDRTRGEVGHCGVTNEARVFHELLHFGEELELIPSHAIYLTGCSFRCVFCMTGEHITRPAASTNGVALDPRAFAARVAARRLEGAKNVNFLGGEPSVNTVAILELLSHCPPDTRVVWNSNLYYTDEQAELLDGVVDVFLADWKYGNPGCAERLSQAPDYPRVVRRNLVRAARHARVIVRYLVMPGHNDCCLRPIVRALSEVLPGAPLSILDPYLPLFRAHQVPGMDRASTPEEGRQARAIAEAAGLEVIS